jgi:hypothetical protein
MRLSNSQTRSEVCYYAQKPSEGADHFRRAAAILEGLVRDYPTQVRYAHDLGECCEHEAVVLRQRAGLRKHSNFLNEPFTYWLMSSESNRTTVTRGSNSALRTWQEPELYSKWGGKTRHGRTGSEWSN